MSFRRTDSVRMPSWRRARLVVSGFRRHDRSVRSQHMVQGNGVLRWTLSTWSCWCEGWNDKMIRNDLSIVEVSTLQDVSISATTATWSCWIVGWPIKAVIKTREARCNQCGSRPGKWFSLSLLGWNRFDSFYHTNSVHIVRSAKSLQCQTAWYSVSPDLRGFSTKIDPTWQGRWCCLKGTEAKSLDAGIPNI